MKKFTIVSSLLFVLLFCGMVGYVALSEDFTPPKEEEETAVPEEDREAPVWNKTGGILKIWPRNLTSIRHMRVSGQKARLIYMAPV